MINYSEIVAKAEAERKALYANLTVELLEDIKDEVKEFRVTGYTPAFNDGDPCEYVSYTSLKNDEGEWDEFWSHNGKYFIEYIEDVIHPHLHNRYGTNFQVTFTYEDGKWREEYEEYDCGY